MKLDNQIIVSNIDKATIGLSVDAAKRKSQLIAAAAPILEVKTPAQLEIAVGAARPIKAMLTEVEKTRSLVKAPVIALGKKIDQIAADYVKELESEVRRITGLVTTFTEAENARIREEQAAIERARLKAESDAAEALRLAEVAKTPKQEIKAEAKVTAAQTTLATVTAMRPVEAARTAGMVSKTVTKWEITDAAALYAVKPEFFELTPRRSVINALVTKATALPGLKVWEQADTNIRG